MTRNKSGADTRFVAWQHGQELTVSICARQWDAIIKIVDQKTQTEMSFEFSLNDAEEMAEFLNREIKSRRGQSLTKFEELKEKMKDDIEE
jgi:hypothetical protein